MIEMMVKISFSNLQWIMVFFLFLCIATEIFYGFVIIFPYSLYLCLFLNSNKFHKRYQRNIEKREKKKMIERFVYILLKGVKGRDHT